MTAYGVMDHESTAHTTPFSVWSGPFASVWEAEGRARHGARSVTIYDYNAEPVKVRLPEGITLPRTNDNYRQIDAAISDALNAHHEA